MTSNALVRPNRTAVAQAQQFDPFARAGEDMGGSNALYMKFNGNSGEYTYGQDSEEIAEGTHMAVNMSELRRGFICWVDSQVKDEKMARVVDGDEIQESNLPDYGPYERRSDGSQDGWSKQAAVALFDPETKKSFILKVSSASGLRGIGTLLKDYAKQYKSHPGEMPLVELTSKAFIPKDKKFGKKHALILNIVGWISEDEMNATTGEDEGDYDKAEEGAEGAEGSETSDAVETEVETTAAPAEKPKPATQGKPAAAPAAGAPRRRGF